MVVIGKFLIVLNKYSQWLKISTTLFLYNNYIPSATAQDAELILQITMLIYPCCGSRNLFCRGKVCWQKEVFCLHSCITSPNTQRSAHKALFCQHSCVHMGVLDGVAILAKNMWFFTLFTDTAVWVKHCRAEVAHTQYVSPSPARLCFSPHHKLITWGMVCWRTE